MIGAIIGLMVGFVIGAISAYKTFQNMKIYRAEHPKEMKDPGDIEIIYKPKLHDDSSDKPEEHVRNTISWNVYD